jgi:hypothetical protein
LPLLAPLLAVLIIAGLNPGPKLALRLLTWNSPQLPLGAWMAAAAATGAILSGGGASLALRQPGPAQRRRLRREESGDGSQAQASERRGEPRGWAARPANRAARASAAPAFDHDDASWQQPSSAGPSRVPGEPAPTLSVPYRVVRRGSSAAPPGSSASRSGGSSGGGRQAWARDLDQAGGAEQPMAESMAPSDDWGDPNLETW